MNKKIKKNPAIFFDRDGVLNKDSGFVYKYSKFKWLPGSIKSRSFLTQRGYFIFIITNQSGIGRGIFSKKEYYILNKKINKFLITKTIKITRIYYCPHHPIYGLGKYKKKCKCRKPDNLLVRKAFKQYHIDRKNSFFIGDKLSDKMCAKKSKLKFFYRKKNLFQQIKKVTK